MATIRHTDRPDVNNDYYNLLQSLSGLTATNAVISQEQFLVYNKSIKFTNGFVNTNQSFLSRLIAADITYKISLNYYHAVLADGDYGLMQVYENANNYLQCWLNKSGANYTVRLKIVQDSTTICDITGTAYTTNNKWNTVEILLNMITGTPVVASVRLISNGKPSSKITNNSLSNFSYWSFTANLLLGRYFDGAINRDFTGYMSVLSIDISGYSIDDFWAWPSATFPNAINHYETYNTTGLNFTPVTQYSVINDKSIFKHNIPDYAYFNSICTIVGMAVNSLVYTIAPVLDPVIDFTGGGSLGIGVYNFQYTYFDALSNRESIPSPLKSYTNPSGSQQAVLTWAGVLPAGYIRHFNKIRIYGNAFNANPVLLKEITFASAIGASLIPIPAITSIGKFVNTAFPCIDPLQLVFTARPITAAISSGGSIPNGTYNYAVTVYNLLTGQESNPVISTSTPVSSGSNHTVTLTINRYTLPSSNYVYRIYRKISTAALYEYVTDSYDTNPVDTSASSNPNITLDLTIKPPPASLYVTKHGDRMYYAAQQLTLSRVYYSEVSAPLRVRDASYFNVGDSNTILTGLHGNFLNMLLAFKEEEVWLYRGLDPTVYEEFRISDAYGCGAHRTIKQVSNIVIFANKKGVYIFNGANVIKISDDIDKIFKDISISNFQLSSAAIDLTNELYILLIPGYKMLAFCYTDYLKTQQAGWTVLDHTGIDYINDGLLPVVNKGYPKQDVVLYGNNTEIGFYLDYTRINNGTAIQTDWFVESQKLTIKLGNKNHLKQIKAYIKAYADNQKLKLGYTINGNVQESQFNAVGQTTEKVEKKIGVRTQFLSVRVYGVSATTNMLLTGFDVSGEKRGFR